MTRIAVIGAGYVGLTTAACFAHLGHDVVAADLDEQRVDRLQRGQLPIVEAGLPELVRAGLAAGNLKFVVGAAAAVPGAAVVFLCVPTPSREDGRVELGFVQRAATEIGPALDDTAIVVDKSTVPVGAARVVETALGRDGIAVVANPEFLREGTAVHDFLHPDRVVVGAHDRRAAEAVAALYRPLTGHVLVTDPASAELVKYAANAFLAMKVSFANAIAAVAEAVGADVDDVVAGVGSDGRIGAPFLHPGPGWGGSCLPKDTLALVRIAEDAGYDFALLRGVIAVNDEQKARVVEKVRRACGGSLLGRAIAVWGLTYKAGTDDVRDSPATAICARLLELGARVQAHDPAAAATPPGVDRAATALAACDGADALVVLTEWPEYATVDPAAVAARLRCSVVVDARAVLDRSAWEGAGFDCRGIGR
jgi:UDPglucose 6-dehydrogenase